MDETMNQIPMAAYILNFVATEFLEVVYKTELGEQLLLIEIRTKPDGTQVLFTAVDGVPIYSTSIPDFVLSRSNCEALSILHNLSLVQEGQTRKCIVVETFVPHRHTSTCSVKLKLTLDSSTFETTECDTLTEAVWELKELTQESSIGINWKFQTCYHCKYSYPAFQWPISDRDHLRCYRDALSSFAEVKEKHKFASFDALADGSYFVTAFHRCAAWQSNEE